MHSINYYWSRTPLLRKILKWKTQYKIQKFVTKEEERRKADPKNLRNFEKKIFSQNGEDGILEEIFNRIGNKDHYFVEFGVEDGKECNGRHLIENLKWSGLWMDGSDENVKNARAQFSKFPIRVEQNFITRENIVELFNKYEVPKEFDLLSIDIDGNDYWVWKALAAYNPRVVVVEYNASYTPGKKWIMPYNAKHLYDGSSYFGASLDSLSSLSKELGYSLVACDQAGVNAFFVRNDLVQDKFTYVDEPSDYHYCSPKYRSLFFGHPSGKGPWRGE